MANDIDTDVLIIGGGIAGPALACALIKTGLSVTMIERSSGDLDTARGDHLQPYTLELLQQWGVLDRFVAAGAEKRRGTRWLNAAGDVLLDARIDTLPLPYPYFLYLNHELISIELLKAAEACPRFRMIRPVKRWSHRQDAKGRHEITIEQQGSQVLTVRADLLVGADGTRSPVRKLMGVNAHTHRYERPIAVLFAQMINAAPGNSLDAWLSQTGIVAVIPRTGGGCKLGLPMKPSEVRSWRDADAGSLSGRMERLLPGLALEDIRYSSVYPPVYLEADRWVKGAMVLIGDACHAMHPARSQGMNTAMRCVAKLVDHLPVNGGRLDRSELPRALEAFERSTRPLIDRILAENHRAGLQMDSSSEVAQDAFAESLRTIARDPSALMAYGMRSAGYPSD